MKCRSKLVCEFNKFLLFRVLIKIWVFSSNYACSLQLSFKFLMLIILLGYTRNYNSMRRLVRCPFTHSSSCFCKTFICVVRRLYCFITITIFLLNRHSKSSPSLCTSALFIKVGCLIQDFRDYCNIESFINGSVFLNYMTLTFLSAVVEIYW